jgi:hypothetical protein
MGLAGKSHFTDPSLLLVVVLCTEANLQYCDLTQQGQPEEEQVFLVLA